MSRHLAKRGQQVLVTDHAWGIEERKADKFLGWEDGCKALPLPEAENTDRRRSLGEKDN